MVQELLADRDPAAEDGVLERHEQRLRERCGGQFDGITLLFEVLTPLHDDSKVLSYEVYRDDAAFETHRNGRSNAQFREDTAGMIGR